MKVKGSVNQLITAFRDDARRRVFSITEIEILWDSAEASNWVALHWYITRHPLEKITVRVIPWRGGNLPNPFLLLNDFILALASSLQHNNTHLVTTLKELDLTEVSPFSVVMHLSEFEFAFSRNSMIKVLRLPHAFDLTLLQPYPRIVQLNQRIPVVPDETNPSHLTTEGMQSLAEFASFIFSPNRRMPCSQRGTISQIISILRSELGNNDISTIYIEWDPTENIQALSDELLVLILKARNLQKIAIVFPGVMLSPDLLEVYHSFVNAICRQFPTYNFPNAALDLSEVQLFMNVPGRWYAIESSCKENPRVLNIILPRSFPVQSREGLLSYCPTLCQRAGITKLQATGSEANFGYSITQDELVEPVDGGNEDEQAETWSDEGEERGGGEEVASERDKQRDQTLSSSIGDDRHCKLQFNAEEQAVIDVLRNNLARLTKWSTSFNVISDKSLQESCTSAFLVFAEIFTVMMSDFVTDVHENRKQLLKDIPAKVQSCEASLHKLEQLLDGVFIIERVLNEADGSINIVGMRLKSARDINKEKLIAHAEEIIAEIKRLGYQKIVSGIEEFVPTLQKILLLKKIEHNLKRVDNFKRAFNFFASETSLQPFYEKVFLSFEGFISECIVEFNANIHTVEKLEDIEQKLHLHENYFDQFEKILELLFTIDTHQQGNSAAIRSMQLKHPFIICSQDVEKQANDLINAVEMNEHHGLAVTIANFITKTLLALGLPVAATGVGAYVGGVIGGVLGLSTVTFTGPAGLIVGASLGAWIGGGAGFVTGTAGGVYVSSKFTFFSPIQTSLTAFAKQSIDYVEEAQAVERLKAAACAA